MQIESWGEGDPALLIHGSPATGQAWKAVAKRLAGRHRVLAPTLPGHGQPPESLQPAETADLAAAVEAGIGDPGAPVVLAAHSYGGNVALQLALRRRLPIRRIVLFEPVTLAALLAAGEHGAYAEAEAAFAPYLEAVAAGNLRAVSIMVDYWFGEGAFARMPAPIQDYLRAAAPANARDVAATFRERVTPAELGAIAAPVTVACGGASPPMALRIARALAARVAHGRIVEIPGADHAMVATHPDEVAALIAG